MEAPSLFSVSEPEELLALWRLVAEAKFHPNPDDGDLWGSPYVNALSQKVADALLATEIARGDVEAVARHQTWIGSLRENVVFSVVKANLRNDASERWWYEMTSEEKASYVRACTTPFVVDEILVEELIRDAEA